MSIITIHYKNFSFSGKNFMFIQLQRRKKLCLHKSHQVCASVTDCFLFCQRVKGA